MGYNEEKHTLNAPLNTFSVARCIGATSGDVGTLCSSQSLINKWAKYKPESNFKRLSSPNEFSLSDRQNNNFGLSLPTASTNILDVVTKIINEEDDGWEYQPINPKTQYTNIADFLHTDSTKDGYFKDAYAPIQGIMVNNEVYSYTSDNALFSLLLLNGESLNLGLSAPTSGENVDLSESLYITLNDLNASIKGKPIKDCYLTLVFGDVIYNLLSKPEFTLQGAISSDVTIGKNGTIALKTGFNGIPFGVFSAFLVGSTEPYSNGVANNYFRLPFSSVRRMRGSINVMQAPPVSIQWLSIAFDVNSTLYGVGASGENLYTDGDVYLVGVFTNEGTSTLKLTESFQLSANRNFLSEANGTGKHLATTYYYDGNDLTIDSLKKDNSSYEGNWVDSGNSLSFAPNESKVLMVGVRNLLLFNQTEQGDILPPARPTDYAYAKTINFALSYRGNEYNGDWKIAPVRMIGYNG